MKKKVAAIIGGVIITMAGSTYAQMDHPMGSYDHMSGEMMNEEQNKMQMPEGMGMHALDIDGHKVNFHIMDSTAFRNYMDNMGHKTHKMKEGMTHYIMMDITDKESNKIKKAMVKMKVIGPNGKAQENTAFAMMGSFGAEFDMKQKGKYQIMTLFKVGDTKHNGGYWYERK